MIRTLLFFVVMYFLVKIISRLFLSSGQSSQRKRGASMFYRTFQQFAQQNQQQQRQQQQRSDNSSSGSSRFDEIEEAEFEEITEDEEASSKTSD